MLSMRCSYIVTPLVISEDPLTVQKLQAYFSNYNASTFHIWKAIMIPTVNWDMGFNRAFDLTPSYLKWPMTSTIKNWILPLNITSLHPKYDKQQKTNTEWQKLKKYLLEYDLDHQNGKQWTFHFTINTHTTSLRT